MRYFGDVFEKNIDVNVFDGVLQNAKHWANDVNRPPLGEGGSDIWDKIPKKSRFFLLGPAL